VRGAPVLVLLLACDRSPLLEGDADELVFRSRGMVPAATAELIVREAAARRNAWATPLYVKAPSTSRGREILGHHCVFLRDYETASGGFRTVHARDDRAMACAEVRRDVELLSDWGRRFAVHWDVRLGKHRGRIPGASGDVARLTSYVCDSADLGDLAAIERRYSDRPR
jgi:hypothetical protein